MNKDTSIDVASTVNENVTPSVVDLMVEKEKISSLDDTTILESFPTLSTPVTTTAGNAPGKSSYANITSKPSGKNVNAHSLFTPEGNGIDVYPVVANYVWNTWGKYELLRSMFSLSTGLFSFQFSSMDGLDAMLENGPWFFQNNPLILKKWHPDENLLKEDGRSSYARVMIELRADVELKDNIVMAMPKITREGHYTCNVSVEYEWKPPRCPSCKVFGHMHEECLKNTCASEKKTVMKPSQTSKGVQVGSKMGFKPHKDRHVPKKSTASSSGNKKKGMEPTIEVSNFNSFDALNSVDNDREFGTNGGTTNLVNNEATSSGSSFMHVDNDRKNPLVSTCIVESDSEVKVVFDETANLRISTSGKDGSDKGYGTNSLLEQWRDFYLDNDDYDPYDDDMYGNHNIPEHLQSICDNLDITTFHYVERFGDMKSGIEFHFEQKGTGANKQKPHVFAKLTSMTQNGMLHFIIRYKIKRNKTTQHFTPWVARALMPRMLTNKESMRDMRWSCDWVKIPSAVTSEKHPTSCGRVVACLETVLDPIYPGGCVGWAKGAWTEPSTVVGPKWEVVPAVGLAVYKGAQDGKYLLLGQIVRWYHEPAIGS
nr:hypothetical protein [Tanacetum cinerariifolium]